MDSEVIIVGSGATAVHLAQTLVEAHRKVLMLDVGVINSQKSTFTNRDLEEKQNFTELRQTDPDQYKYFLGGELESVKWEPIGIGAQLTPARKYMLDKVDELIPNKSDIFSPYESLANGGLGVGWGAGCYEFSSAELMRCGLDVDELQKAYKVVSERIGISTPGADIKKFTANSFEPSENQVQMTKLFQSVLKSYDNNRQILNKNNFYLGASSLALLSKDRLGRKAHAYREMEFYNDIEKSVYRPWMTLEQLKARSNFTYVSNVLVTSFKETSDRVEIFGVDIKSKEKLNFSAKILSLAAGTLGSARIVLRSTLYEEELPLLCNKYSYYPSLSLPNVGKSMDRHSLALSQLMMFHQNQGRDDDIATASLYSYKSLM
ncbi:MAG: hypothetical protein ABL927_11070, partial [Bdellovibrionales bacterium]